MNEIRLEASRRELLGKGVRTLRRQGILPAHLYGPHVSPVALQLDAHTFQRVWARAGALSLIDLQVDGRHSMVLIREVQRDVTTGAPLHVDFFAVAMTERLRANVPIVTVGEAPAVRRGGVLLRPIDALEIESLPRDLPHQIDVDISGLEDFESGVHVRDLVAPAGATILTSGDELVVKVAAPTVEVEEIAPPTPEGPVAHAGVPEAPERESEAGA